MGRLIFTLLITLFSEVMLYAQHVRKGVNSSNERQEQSGYDTDQQTHQEGVAAGVEKAKEEELKAMNTDPINSDSSSNVAEAVDTLSGYIEHYHGRDMTYRSDEELYNKRLILDDQELNPSSSFFLAGATQFDSRIETKQLSDTIPWQRKVRDITESVGILVERNKLHQITATTYQLDIGITLAQKYALCPGEPFGTQPVLGTGTAFVIDENRLLTAAHVFEGPAENYVLIFGFKMANKKGKFDELITADQVYFPKQIIKRDEQLDIAMFLVDRPLQRPVLTLAKTRPALHTPVYMIGYPSGLPQKVAWNAEIIENTNPMFSYTSLDAFQGNSGSPVFNRTTNEVIGILVSGQVDYTWNSGCYISSMCRKPYCDGEKMINSHVVVAELMDD